MVGIKTLFKNAPPTVWNKPISPASIFAFFKLLPLSIINDVIAMVCPAANGTSPAIAIVSAATIGVISAIATVLAPSSPCIAVISPSIVVMVLSIPEIFPLIVMISFLSVSNRLSTFTQPLLNGFIASLCYKSIQRRDQSRA